MFKSDIEINNKSYSVQVHTQNNDSDFSNEKLVSFEKDFQNLVEWIDSIKSVSNIDLKIEKFTMFENRPENFILSVDLSFKLDFGIYYNSKEIKDIIQTQGIRFSRGNRYWFLFEMEKNYIQLYMFPYYRY